MVTWTWYTLLQAYYYYLYRGERPHFSRTPTVFSRVELMQRRRADCAGLAVAAAVAGAVAVDVVAVVIVAPAANSVS